MIKLIEKYKLNNEIISPQNAQFLLPITSFIILSLGIILFAMTPLISTKNKKLAEIKIDRQKSNDLPFLKLKNKAVKKQLENQKIKKELIVEMVAGEKELRTLLSKLGAITNNHSIELIEIIPNQVRRFEGGAQTLEANVTSFGDPLVTQGIEKHSANIFLRGYFMNFVEFLREIESLESIVITNDIQIIDDNVVDISKVNKIDLIMELSAYGRVKE